MAEQLSRVSTIMMAERFKSARESNVEWQDLIVFLSGYLPILPIYEEGTQTATTILQKVYGINDTKQISEKGLRIIFSNSEQRGLHTHNWRDLCNSSYNLLNARIGPPTLDE